MEDFHIKVKVVLEQLEIIPILHDFYIQLIQIQMKVVYSICKKKLRFDEEKKKGKFIPSKIKKYILKEMKIYFSLKNYPGAGRSPANRDLGPWPDFDTHLASLLRPFSTWKR